MQNPKDILGKFVSKNSKFFDLADGAEDTIKFMGAEAVTTFFNGQEKESIRYHFEKDGNKLMWDRTNRELAKQMMAFSIGDVLRIKRTGQKNQTRYQIKKVD